MGRRNQPINGLTVTRASHVATDGAKRVPSELDALRDGLKELNYDEGRNIVIEAQWDGDPSRLPESRGQ